MSFAQGRHLAALAEHHLKPLLRRQRRQIVQLELDFRTLVMRACFQDRHAIHLDREHNGTATRQVYSTAFPRPEQVSCQEFQEAGRAMLLAGIGLCLPERAHAGKEPALSRSV
jgi:hypothetical protein